MTALDLRNGRITKEIADKLVFEFEGKRPPSLDVFLSYLNMTEDEFNEIIEPLLNPPTKPDLNTLQYAPKTSDFEDWYKE